MHKDDCNITPIRIQIAKNGPIGYRERQGTALSEDGAFYWVRWDNDNTEEWIEKRYAIPTSMELSKSSL